MNPSDRIFTAAFVYLYDTKWGLQRANWTPPVISRLEFLRNSLSLSRAEAALVIHDSTLYPPYATAFAILFDATLGPFRVYLEYDVSVDDIRFIIPLRKRARMAFQRAIMIAAIPVDNTVL